MPRRFCIEPDSGQRYQFTLEQLSNAELARNNHKLHAKLQKMMASYQEVEQENVLLKEKCLKLENSLKMILEMQVRLWLGPVENAL